MYQRAVVLASAMRLRTTSTPTERAVWNPKVSISGGRSRSLSIVLGTCATRMSPDARSLTWKALYAVSSPPMVMSLSTPFDRSESITRSRSSGSAVGFAREMPSVEPPRR